MGYDVFISDASEDRETVTTPLAVALRAIGAEVWVDSHALALGDTLRAGIDRGLSESRYGVVILSRAFFEKAWTQRELAALVALERGDRKVILPVLHGMTVEELAQERLAGPQLVALANEILAGDR
ncbi:toll/interleukin-1 receptor domain-containing protein [Dactylosporangium sp. NPDC049525]|uniref:toll/interleukin-1 receptor domain-containing protein n=1 Tax=Dactylosporangium sp. NPDC049525 TaxID=3154730 RepID=UPI00344256E4